MRALYLLFALAAAAVPANAANLTVEVMAAGKPVANAVVAVHAATGESPAPRIAGPYVVDQKNIEFHPFVSVVPVGADVSFPNRDPIRHHVYSFSPAKRFELKLYARDQSRSVRFEKPGIIAIGCNIHDSMSAFLYVADSAWTAKTDAAGRVTLSGLPAGAVDLSVWHPFLRAPGNEIDRVLNLTAANRNETVSVLLRPPPMPDRIGGY